MPEDKSPREGKSFSIPKTRISFGEQNTCKENNRQKVGEQD